MDSFEIFFEKRARNPLRKRELKNNLSYKDWIESEKENLPDEEKEKIERMKEFKVEPERIETFRQAKIEEYRKKLENDYLRTKVQKPKLIFVKYGIKVFQDKYVSEDFSSGSLNNRILQSIVNKVIVQYKDIIPNRKPKIVITNTDKNPVTKGVNIIGGKKSPPGVYHDRLIYLYQYHADNIKILVHEYAHFLADRIPKQIEPLIKEEYKKMLQEYFGKKTRRQKLEGKKNEHHRIAMANRLGLPSDYSTANYDEWFAELITYWKNLPNDRNGYRFKQVLKKVINRL